MLVENENPEHRDSLSLHCIVQVHTRTDIPVDQVGAPKIKPTRMVLYDCEDRLRLKSRNVGV